VTFTTVPSATVSAGTGQVREVAVMEAAVDVNESVSFGQKKHCPTVSEKTEFVPEIVRVAPVPAVVGATDLIVGTVVEVQSVPAAVP